MSRNADFVLVKDRVPRSGKGVENLLAQITQYLRAPENKYVQKMVVDAELIYIYFEKLVPKDQAPEEAKLSWHNAVRTVAMEEVPANGRPLHEYLYDLVETVNANRYEVCQVLIGAHSAIYKLMGLPHKTTHILGVPITKDGEIPDDVIIVCGGTSRECDPEEVAYSVKGTIE